MTKKNRLHLVRAKAGNIPIPPDFWGLASDAEWKDICDCGSIRGDGLIRLWSMLGRGDPLPTELKVYISRKDLLRAFPEIKR